MSHVRAREKPGLRRHRRFHPFELKLRAVKLRLEEGLPHEDIAAATALSGCASPSDSSAPMPTMWLTATTATGWTVWPESCPEARRLHPFRPRRLAGSGRGQPGGDLLGQEVRREVV